MITLPLRWQRFLARAARAAFTGAAGLVVASSPGHAQSRGPAPAEGGAGGAPTVRPSGAKATPARTPSRRPAARRAARARAPLPPLRYTAPASGAALAADISSFLGARVRGGSWGAMIVSLTRGDTLYAMNEGLHLVPASTMKMFTAALALDAFGPDHQFSTDVLRDGAVGADGILEGSLVLRGGGDPGFSTRFHRTPAGGPMATLAELVANTGIRRVRGDLIADESAFEPKRVPDGWLSRYLEAGYAARVSALSLNENLATVAITPSAGAGAAHVALDPPSTTVPVVNNVRTVAGSRGAKLSVRRLADGRLEARGWIGSRAGRRAYLVVVDDPATWAAGTFRAALAARGVIVDGQVRLAPTPPTAVPVVSLPSPPLTKLTSVMNRESINHYGELLFRNVARQANPEGPGSADFGHTVLRRFMAEKVGANPDDVYAADGSGLSTLDRVTPRSLIQLLSYAHGAPWGADFHASLPVAGESELLRHRMRYTPAHGNLHAKTGTTDEVIALGGYVTARNGEILAFAFIYNGRDRWNAREAIDVSGATLAGFIRN